MAEFKESNIFVKQVLKAVEFREMDFLHKAELQENAEAFIDFPLPHVTSDDVQTGFRQWDPFGRYVEPELDEEVEAELDSMVSDEPVQIPQEILDAMDRLAQVEAALNQKEKELVDLQIQLSEQQKELGQKHESLEAKEKKLFEEEEELIELTEKIGFIFQSLERKNKEVYRVHSDEVAGFAVTLAGRILQKEIKEDPSVLSKQIKSVLDDMSEREEGVEIRLSADDFEFFKNCHEEEVKALVVRPYLKWIQDEKLQAGQIYVDTKHYRLDASILTALDAIRRDLRLGDVAQTSQMKTIVTDESRSGSDSNKSESTKNINPTDVKE